MQQIHKTFSHNENYIFPLNRKFGLIRLKKERLWSVVFYSRVHSYNWPDFFPPTLWGLANSPVKTLNIEITKSKKYLSCILASVTQESILFSLQMSAFEMPEMILTRNHKLCIHIKI